MSISYHPYHLETLVAANTEITPSTKGKMSLITLFKMFFNAPRNIPAIKIFNDLLLIECTNIVLKNLYCPIIIMILFKTH